MVNFRNASVERQVKLNIEWYGDSYTFTRLGKNEFGEISDVPIEVITIRGIYHDSGRKLDLYRVLNMTAYGTYVSESMPQITCLWEDAKQLRLNDYTVLNGVDYIVTGVYNVHEINVLGEVSLKLVQKENKGD